jgi:hypothetical protein
MATPDTAAAISEAADTVVKGTQGASVWLGS